MELIMTGLDHKRASLETREKFALTNEKTGQILKALKDVGIVGGNVLISTCNRTEFYASVPEAGRFEAAKTLCKALDREYSEYKHIFTEKTGAQAIDHLCRVASGIDSQIMGDDQIITQTREALELSRKIKCVDSYIETMFRYSIQAAKAIKTNVILKTLGADSVPDKTIEKLKTLIAEARAGETSKKANCTTHPPLSSLLSPLSSSKSDLAGLNALVIGNGQIGRHVAELLIREKANVTITLREYKKGIIIVPSGAETISYSERYKAINSADIVISATRSPHFTLHYKELAGLDRKPEIIVDLAVPRDVDPEIQEIPGTKLLTIDDITGENRTLPPESATEIEKIIKTHTEKYQKWLTYKESVATQNLALGRLF